MPTRTPRTARLVGVAVCCVSLVGCILAVDPERFGTTCHFEGEATQCGACIVAHCQQPLNDCCRDASCEAVVDAIDGCAANADQGCATVRADAPRFDVAKCIVDACDEVCSTREGTSQTACKEPLLAPGAACSCQVAGGAAANDVVCNQRAFPDTICCAPEDWPAAGLECTCKPVGCSSTTDGCICITANSVPERRTCDSTKCCVFEDQCICGRSCFVQETPVESCSVATLGCAAGQKRVDRCSMRTN